MPNNLTGNSSMNDCKWVIFHKSVKISGGFLWLCLKTWQSSDWSSFSPVELPLEAPSPLRHLGCPVVFQIIDLHALSCSAKFSFPACTHSITFFPPLGHLEFWWRCGDFGWILDKSRYQGHECAAVSAARQRAPFFSRNPAQLSWITQTSFQ